jgi:hypothetical protein
MMLALGISAFAGGLKSDLDEAIDKSIVPGDGLRKDLLEARFKVWPGHDTMEGVAIFYDSWKQAIDDKQYYVNHKDWKNMEMTREENVICDKIPAFATMRKWLEAPRDEIVTYLIQRVEKSELNDLFRDMSFLSFYSDDPRVPKCFASFLNDKRLFYETRGSKTFPVGRVSDSAEGFLRKWLEKEGVLKWGDPGFVWDSPTLKDRDNNIAAIRPFLIERGVIVGDEQYSRQSRDTTSVKKNNTRPERRGFDGNKDAKTHGETDGVADVWICLGMAAGALIGIGLLWRVFKFRRP